MVFSYQLVKPHTSPYDVGSRSSATKMKLKKKVDHPSQDQVNVWIYTANEINKNQFSQYLLLYLMIYKQLNLQCSVV